MLLSKAEEKSLLGLETLNLKLLHFTNGYTQLKEVAKGVAVNGSIYAAGIFVAVSARLMHIKSIKKY